MTPRFQTIHTLLSFVINGRALDYHLLPSILRHTYTTQRFYTNKRALLPTVLELKLQIPKKSTALFYMEPFVIAFA